MRRLSAGLVGIALLFGIAAAAASPPEPVEAEWTSEQRAESQLSAAALPAPQLTDCGLNGVLGAVTSVTLTWKSTTPVSPRTFRVAAVMGANATPTTGNVSVTPTLVGGTVDTYTATISLDLLTTLLTGLLGATATLGVSETSGTQWQSGWGRAELRIALLGLLLGSSCRVL